jgi:hypothetical protein
VFATTPNVLPILSFVVTISNLFCSYYILLEIWLIINNIFFLKFALLLVTGKKGPISRLPKMESGYRTPIGGVIVAIDVNSEGLGVWCQDDGHQGQVDNVDMFRHICIGCKEFGPPIKSTVVKWVVPPLSLLQSSANVFCVVLTTRSSSGKAIPVSFFKKLQDTVVENSP